MVSSHVYEIIKTIYNSPASTQTDSARVAVLQNTLIQLRLTNIATLDALMTHFTRLLELTSADETYITSLAQSLAPCVLRPRVENSLTMDEKHSYRLIRDLFAHKSQIFSELKRASSLSHSQSVTDTRPRAVSTDESNRKANMEARQRAILDASSGPQGRSRATSPNPGARGHRRDRSSGGPGTRFPVATAATPATARTSAGDRSSLGSNRENRSSLEVPGAESSSTSEPATTNVPLTSATILNPITNGSDTFSNYTPIPGSDEVDSDNGLGKRNSLGRSGHASARTRKPIGSSSLNRLSMAGGSDSQENSDGSRGVSLTDKPMDD